MTKKDFNAKADYHSYGKYLHAIFFDWQETNDGRGFKYMIKCRKNLMTKKDLMNVLYEWAIKDNKDAFSYFVGYKFAQTDADRFKVPVAM
jgi:hypothetical protein